MLENSGGAIAPNRTMGEFRDLMEYNYENGIKGYEDYPSSLEGASCALHAQLICLRRFHARHRRAHHRGHDRQRVRYPGCQTVRGPR